MPTQESSGHVALLPGTLDLLILSSLLFGMRHGQGIARLIQAQSEDLFWVDHGSLYTALRRLRDRKEVTARWGRSENNRQACFYSLTENGQRQLNERVSEWRRLIRGVGLILDA